MYSIINKINKINHLNYFDIEADPCVHAINREICVQLTQRERAGLSGIFEPVAVADAQVMERASDDAAEDGPDHASGQWSFGDAGRPQVQVVGRRVHAGKVFERLVAKDTLQVVPGASSLQTAVAAVGVVRRDSIWFATRRYSFFSWH